MSPVIKIRSADAASLAGSVLITFDALKTHCVQIELAPGVAEGLAYDLLNVAKQARFEAEREAATVRWVQAARERYAHFREGGLL